MPNKPKLTKREDGLYQRSIVTGRKPDGKYQRRTFYAKTVKELDQKVAEYDRKMRMGMLTADENATFLEVAESWMKDAKAGASGKSMQRYRTNVYTHLEPLHGMRMLDLRPTHLQGIINRLAAEGRSQSTLAILKQTACQIMRYAMENDVIMRNVFENVTVPHIEPKERTAITEEQRALVMRTWQDHGMGIPVLLMMYCGLRRGEMVALTWADVDTDKGTVAVNKSVEIVSNQPRIKAPKTAAGNRVVPIPRVILPYIEQAKKAKKSLYVMPSASGSIMTHQAFEGAWSSFQHHLNMVAGGRVASRSRTKIVAIEPFTAHQLRHTYATMLYDAGVDVKTAQYLLGHASLQVTMGIYTHLTKEKKVGEIEKLDAYLAEKLA